MAIFVLLSKLLDNTIDKAEFSKGLTLLKMLNLVNARWVCNSIIPRIHNFHNDLPN